MFLMPRFVEPVQPFTVATALVFDAAQAQSLRSLDLATAAAVLTDLGGLYRETGRAKQAVATLEHASSLAPEDPRVKRSLARALTIRNKTGDRDRASRLFPGPGPARSPRAARADERAALVRAGSRERFSRVMAELRNATRPGCECPPAARAGLPKSDRLPRWV